MESSFINIVLQNGPVKQNGINGCQIDDVLIWCKDKLFEFQIRVPCCETEQAILHIKEAIALLEKRKEDRIARGVEGSYSV